MRAGPKNIYLVHLQDEFFRLQTLLVDLLDSDSFSGDSVPALEDFSVGALPEDLLRIRFVQVGDGAELGRTIEPMHPQVSLISRLQKEHAFVDLRQLYLDLPILDPVYFLVRQLLLLLRLIKKR